MDYKQASALLGVSERTVYNWIDSGKLEATKGVNGELVISPEAVENVRQQEETKLKKRADEIKNVSVRSKYDEHINNQIDRHMNVIHSLCKNFIHDRDIETLEKINKRHDEIKQLESSKSNFSKFVNKNITPLKGE